MGENSSIEWTHHTYNPWWGCVRCSPACDRCYAERWAKYQLPAGWLIVGEDLAVPRLTMNGDSKRPEIWGASAPRVFPPLDSPVLRAPLRWNRNALARGQRHRVFVASMCDICERHRSREVNRMMNERREQFFVNIVPKCDALDFLLLTKRPHDIMRLVPSAWRTAWPANVWVGCTVEDQQRADQRLPHLVAVPAPVRFISSEPLLGPLDLSPWLGQLGWVIVGGESDANARPSQIAWVRDVRDQVVAAKKRFFFKQWGNHAQEAGRGNELVKIRTKNFRSLDGREWNEVPAAASPCGSAL